MAALKKRPVSQQTSRAFFVHSRRGIADNENGPEPLSRPPTSSSFGPRSSDATLWFTPAGWNVSKLSDLSDTIRAALNKGKRLTLIELEDLTFVLNMMIADELVEATPSKNQAETQKVGLKLVQRTKLDKLLADILFAHEEARDDVTSKDKIAATGLWPVLEASRSLQAYWRTRFKPEYLTIDKRRYDHLASSMRGVLFRSTAAEQQETRVSSQPEGRRHFVPGQWWLNLDCANRDGIVGDNVERLTKGRFGTAALPLLTGFEEHVPGGKTEYIRRGSSRDMHYNLLSQVGRKTKVLRGFRLKSMYAPEAGVRYDGLYKLSSWSVKLCACTNLWTLKITLERLPGQNPLKEVLKIPKPSQLDDWALYEKLQREVIKQRDGDGKLTDWTTTQDKERAERDYWHQIWALQQGSGLSEPGSEPPSPGGTLESDGSSSSDTVTELGSPS